MIYQKLEQIKCQTCLIWAGRQDKLVPKRKPYYVRGKELIILPFGSTALRRCRECNLDLKAYWYAKRESETVTVNETLCV